MLIGGALILIGIYLAVRAPASEQCAAASRVTLWTACAREHGSLVPTIFPRNRIRYVRILVEQCRQCPPFSRTGTNMSWSAVGSQRSRSARATRKIQENLRQSPTRLTRRAHVSKQGRVTDRPCRMGKRKAWVKMILPAHLYLEQLGIPYEARSFPPNTEKGAASVAPRSDFGTSGRQDADFSDRYGRAGAGYARRRSVRDIQETLKKAIGSRNVRMAPPEIVKETTGYMIGSIPPFGWQPEGFRSFLERSLLSEPISGVGAGQWGNEIMISPENLRRASKAVLVNLTSAGAPVIGS